MYRSTDMKTWVPLFKITAKNYISSMEMLNGDFYFGVGSGTTSADWVNTGNILRLKAQYVPGT